MYKGKTHVAMMKTFFMWHGRPQGAETLGLQAQPVEKFSRMAALKEHKATGKPMGKLAWNPKPDSLHDEVSKAQIIFKASQCSEITTISSVDKTKMGHSLDTFELIKIIA